VNTPEQAARGVDHRGHAEALAAHFQQALFERGGDGHARQVVAAPHDVADMQQQLAAQRPARMRTREILAVKPRASSSATASASPMASTAVVLAVGARFSGQASSATADVDVHVGLARQRGFPAGHRDHRNAEALISGGAPAVRASRRNWTGQHHVAARDHAEVAVAGLGRMHEERRRAGAGQRRRDLVRDMAGLAHAGDHDPTRCSRGSARRRARMCRRCAASWATSPGFDVEGAPAGGNQVEVGHLLASGLVA
jgi:hypothetical protein